MSEKCKKCNKDTKRNIHYSIPAIWGRDKDNNLVKKLEGGIHCLECWKKEEKNYRWYVPDYSGICVAKIFPHDCGTDSGEYYWDLKTNSWNDPDIPIDPNDKIPNYWVGCFNCGWERELKDNERHTVVKCEKCRPLSDAGNDKIEVYPADKRKSKNSSKCPKCNDPTRENQVCGSCENVKKLFERNKLKQAKLENDGGLSLQIEITTGRNVWNKISVSKLEDKYEGGVWKPIKDYLQRTKKTNLAYENGELKLGNSKNDDNNTHRERERERESKFAFRDTAIRANY